MYSKKVFFSLWLIFILSFRSVFPGFNFSHETSTFRVGDSSNAASFYLNANVTGWDGTLHLGANGSISNLTSKTIGFTNGVLDNNKVRSRTTSTYEPGGTFAIQLGNDQFLTGQPGQLPETLRIEGTNVTIEGEQSFAYPLIFDTSATVSLGLRNRLNQNIVFHSSVTNTLYLIDDLKLEDGVTIYNDGTIDVNGQSFWFGGETMTLTNKIYWLNAGDINLAGRLNLTGTWNIKKDQTVNGHSNILDVSGGGVFSLQASSTLYLTDVTLMGVQDSTFVFADNGSTVRMSNVTIQLLENVTHTSGLFYIDGPTEAYLPDGVDWIFSGDSLFTVSAVTVWKDNVGAAVIGDITGNLSMVFNGTIKEISDTGDLNSVWDWIFSNSNALVATDDLLRFIHGPRDFNFSSNMTLTVDTFMSNDHVFTLGGDVVLSGSYHSMRFASGDENVFDVGTNNLTFQDIVLKDFFPQAMSVSSGSIIFGNGTTIEMSDNNWLSSNGYTMSFDGQATINGHGNEIDLSNLQHGLDVLPSATLRIYNARISGLGGSGADYINNMKCIGPDSTLTLSNCELMMQNNYSFTEGYLNIYQDVVIRGPENPAGTPLVFAYTSSYNSTIRSLGSLMIDRYVTYSYDPNVANKTLITFEDATSILHLNGCTFLSTKTSPILTGGRLVIQDKVTVLNEATSISEALVLKDPLEIDVLSGGVLDLIDGLIEHQ